MAGQADGSIIVDTEIDARGFKADSAELQRAIKSLNTKMDALGPTFQKALSGNTSALSTFDSKATALERTISELEAKMENLSNSRIPTDGYTELKNSAKAAEKQLFSLYDKQDKMEATGVKENSRSWQSLQYDIKNAEDALKRYETAIAEMESSGTAFQMGTDTAEYAQLETALAAASNRLAEMQSSVSGANVHVNSFISALRNAAPLSERIKSGLNGVANLASRVGGAFMSVGGGIKNAVVHPLQTLNKGVGAAISGFGYLAKKGVSALAKIGSGIKSGISKLHTFSKTASGGCTSAIGGLGKKIAGLGNMLKRMAIRKLIMAAFTAVKDGVNNLAQYSGKTNAALSTLKSGLTQLKNSLATAFAPILTAVTPILATLINYISTALTYIGKLFAALSGAKTFTKATAVQEDYASSLGSTGKAAKEAKRQLAGFDELNVLTDSSSGGGGSGGSGISPSEMFEEVPIESSITDFVKSLKDAFKKGDYAAIGKIIGNGINTAVQKVNDFIRWDNVGGAITKFITGFADGFNALIDTVDWKLIGDTIAQGFNTIVNTLHLLVTKIDWPAIGAAFANGLNGIVTGINWGKLGTLLSDGFRRIVATLRSAITTFDWMSLGKGVADGVNAIDWVGILSDLAGGISDILIAALDLLIGFAENLDWGKLGSDLWNGLVGIITNIDWGGLISKAFRLLGNASGGAWSLIIGFCNDLWESIKSGFESTKSYFQSYIEEAGGNVIQGLFNGIVDAVAGVGNWIVENIFNPFINGFKNAFGIHSPSTVMAEQGDFIIQGLLSGITNAWGSITGFFSDTLASLGSTISGAWEGIKSSASTAWNGITTTVSGIWDSLKTTASTKWNNLQATISTGWENIKTTASTKWETIKTTLSGKWEDIKTTASTKWNNLKSTIATGWDNIKTSASEKWETIKSTISGKWEKMKTDASTWGKDVCQNMANGIEKAKSTVENAVKGVANKIKSFLGFSEPETGPLSNFHTYMPDMIDLMTYGIKKNQGTAISAVSGMTSAISNAIRNGDYALPAELNRGSANIALNVDGTEKLDNVLTSFSDKVSDNFINLFDRLQAIAERVTFAAPVVASGRIMPYSVSASANGSNSGINEAITASNDELSSVIIQSVTNATAAIVGAIQDYSGTTVNLDSNSIATNVIKEINRRTRMNGKSPLTV